jgi:hypothetical protein
MSTELEAITLIEFTHTVNGLIGVDPREERGGRIEPDETGLAFG